MKSQHLLLVIALTPVSLPASGFCQSTNNTSQTDTQAPVGSEKNPLRVSSGIVAGNLLQHKSPLYPVSEGPYGSGAVVAHVIITPAGKVDQLTIISGPESLRKRFIETVKQWTYRPYLLNGTAVWTQTTISMNICFGG